MIVWREARVVQKRISQEQLTEIERLAAKIEPKLAGAIRAYLEKLTGAVSLDDLIAALKSGDVGLVLDALAAFGASAEAAKIAEAAQDAAWAGGALAAAKIALRPAAVGFAFDRLNPTLVSFLQSYSLSLIRQIDDTTREAVRQSLLRGMQDGSNPLDTARLVRESIGLTRRQSAAVAAYRKELETFHRRRSAQAFGLGRKIDRIGELQVFRPDEDGEPKDGIRHRRLRDFRYDRTLIRAMETGKPIPPEKIDKMVAAYARKYRKYRSQTIARTETLRATNFGVQNAWEQAVEAGKVPAESVRRRWKVAHDERLCSLCAPVPGLNPSGGVPLGSPFTTPSGPQMLPPLHPNCRCTIFITVDEGNDGQ